METKTGLKARIVNRIEQIPREDWDQAFPKVLESHSFLKTLDESSFDEFSFFYIIIYDNEVPVGAASCFLMDFPLDLAVSGPFKLFFKSIKFILPNIFKQKTLFCGLPMGPGRIGIVRDSQQVMEKISQSLEKIAKEQKAAMIIFKDFTSEYEAGLKPLLSKGFSRIESFPFTQMDIRFKSFDEYLKTLSRSSRENLKRNFKKVDNKVKIDLEVVGKLEDKVLGEAYALYLETYNKQEMSFEKLSEDFFRNIQRNMPQETKFFLWRIEGKLVAFAFCLVAGDCFIDYYLGFDYSVAHNYCLYFIRFRGLMEWCIKHGIKKYEMGVTTYEPKRRLGFNFVRFFFYIKHRNKFINYFSGMISYFIGPVKFDPIFKIMEKRKLE